MINKQDFLLTLTIFFCSMLLVCAQNQTDTSKDTLGNSINDVKKTSKKKKNILPIIVPVTEPAVGVGLIGGGLYFIPKSDPKQKSDMVAAAAGLTTNGTWFAGGGYLGFWKEDKIRYTGFSGYGQITLDYYVLGGDTPITFDQNVFIFLQQANFRLGKSDFFLGGKYQLSQITVPVDEDIDGDNIDPEDLDLLNSGISVISEYDNLNNFLSPTKGIKVHLSYDQNLEVLGSQRDWGSLNFYTHMYFPVNEKWIPSFRIEATTVTGKPPFYAYPYVSLRGIPALRYQGNSVLTTETEQLYNISSKWGLVGFTGIGATYDSIEVGKAKEIVWNAGVGARFLVLKDMGLKIGADIARGPEDWAFYMIVGSAW